MEPRMNRGIPCVTAEDISARELHERIMKFKARMNGQVLINLSNHPSSGWSDEQIQACNLQPGFEIFDIPFPNVDPEMDERLIEAHAEALADLIECKIIEFRSRFRDEFDKEFPTPGMFQSRLQPDFCPMVHLAGEPTLVVAILNRLRFVVVSATTKRDTVINDDGSKTTKFNFVRFRKYPRMIVEN